MTKDQIDNIFTYHPPFGSQTTRYELLREVARTLAYRINTSCPESPQKFLALTAVQQAVMWANAAIACNEQPPISETVAPR